MGTRAPGSPRTWGIFFLVVFVVLVVVQGGWGLTFHDQLAARLWGAGAAGLGLLSGFSTGATTELSSKTEFVKYLGAGVLVPLIGGLGALVDKAEKVTEKSVYVGTTLVEKTTTTLSEPLAGSLHPLAVLGSFFGLFAIFAILGIVVGVLLKKEGFELKGAR
jgi:hypothetical protein